MNKDSVFTTDFVSTVHAMLEKECADNKAITRKTICSHLDLPPVFESTIGILISLNIIPGFDNIKGVGIVKKGAKNVKRSSNSQSSANNELNIHLTDDFKDKLRLTLLQRCSTDPKRSVSRKAIAEFMGSAGSLTEQLISLALKTEEFNNYKMRVGRNGGIYRVNCSAINHVETSSQPVTESQPGPASKVESSIITETEDNPQDLQDIILDELSASFEDDVESEDDDTPILPISYLNSNSPLARYHAQRREEKLTQ